MRYLHVLLFVGVYIALGYMLKLGANEYLLLGIPLMLLFQLAIVRQPLRKLWLRDSEKFRLSIAGIIIAIAVAVFPAFNLVSMFIHQKWNFASVGFHVVSLAGAVGAGFCYSNFSRKTTKEFFLCLSVAGAIGCGFILLRAFFLLTINHEPMQFSAAVAGVSLLQYLPVCFVLEEVVFRGMLDTYLHPPGGKYGFLNAFYISALWGLWHLPIAPAADTVTVIGMGIGFIIIHSFIGIPLSIFWRRSGNLAVPAFTHAFIDAVRNAMMKM